jgi:V8-like Glu-specific endopeptidase
MTWDMTTSDCARLRARQGPARLGAVALILGALAVSLATVESEALAQPRYLPATEYGRINVRTPQAVQVHLESLQASNDFEQVSAFREDSRYRRAANPVGRLQIMVRRDDGRMGVALCTASVLSAEYILTNYHCLPGPVNLTALQANLQMGYLDESDTRQVRRFEVEVRPVEADAVLDYAILRVEGDPARDFGTVTISASAPQVREAVFIIHHPEGKPKTLSRKDCYVSVLAGAQFVHTCDTLGGSSGSPIYSSESFQVIGLHYAGSEEGNHGRSMAALAARSRMLEGIAVVPSSSPAGAGPTVSVELDSRPSGATIIHDGTAVGLTPLTFAMAPQPSYAFRLRKAGYEDATALLTPENGKAQAMVTLRRSLTAAVAPRPPAGFDPAADQVARALEFWRQLEKSGFTKETPGKTDTGRADDPQVQGANDLLDKLGGSKPE